VFAEGPEYRCTVSEEFIANQQLTGERERQERGRERKRERFTV
jgi:hypothetical protein